MSKSSLEAAAEAAAKVNAMLIAKGKLKLSPSQIKPKIGNNMLGRTKAIGDLVTAEVDINDAPLSARNLLTRGHMQDEICKFSGAAISTRGRYMTPEERQSIATPECRPLYLNVQASSYDAVKVAVRKIQEIIDHHVQASGIPKNATVGIVTYPATSSNGTYGVSSAMQTGHIPSGSHFVQDKVFVGLEQAAADYPVREKILGPGGSFLQHIRTETGATVTLRGKGSGFIEPTSGREAFEPLYIHITHPKPEGLHAARALAVNLVETAHVEYAQWQQTQQQTILQPLTSVVLPQATPVAYQNQVMVTPTVLPVNPGALPAGTGVVATGIQIPASVAAGVSFSAANTPCSYSLTAGIPNLIHANVPTLVTPVSVMSSVPVSVQGIPSNTVISYPTYVASTNPVIARQTNPVLARPAIPTVSIIGLMPALQTTTYTAAQPRAPYPNPHQLSYAQPIGYTTIPAPQQTNLNQASVSPTSLVMSVSDTANYPVAATRFAAAPPVHQEAEVVKRRFYNGMEGGSRGYAGSDLLTCLQESNVNHPTELPIRRGTMKRAPEDRDLMPPPVGPVVSSTTAEDDYQEERSTEDLEPERKKFKGALGGLASTYGSDDSDEDTPLSPTAKKNFNSVPR